MNIAKRLLSMIVLMLLLSVNIVIADDDNSDHLYKLFLRTDGLGFYTCLCVVEGCNERFNVYPQGYEVGVQVTEDECAHVFRKGDKVNRVNIVAMGNLHHEVAQWYTCVCEFCGETVEAYDTDGSMYWHNVSEWEGIHIDGEHKHLYVGHCDDCGKLQYDITNCMQNKDGTCMGGRRFSSPTFE